jgi:hypothetical protein
MNYAVRAAGACGRVRAWQLGGPQDFDFIFGRWRVHNRKLRNVADPACEEWVEFDAASHAFPVLHGAGHIDRIYIPDPPDGDAFEGLTLRMLDPTAGTWSIWWSSTGAPGRLDPLVVGRFTGNHGVFDCDDIIGGDAVKVRFEWHADARRLPGGSPSPTTRAVRGS